MNDDGEVEALRSLGQPAVDHPAAFRWHASGKKNRPFEEEININLVYYRPS